MGFLILILLVVGAVVAYRWYTQRPDGSLPASKNQSALDIAKERYARGEITKEEYERLRDDLRSS